MRLMRFGLALTVVNLVLLVVLLAELHPLTAQDAPPPVLRARALQIVDAQGRTRAEFLVHGPERVGGKLYPETVLFRMANENRAPLVKLAVSANGCALGLGNDGKGAVELRADEKGTYVRVLDKDGREQIVRP